jgi:hypothetical protein
VRHSFRRATFAPAAAMFKGADGNLQDVDCNGTPAEEQGRHRCQFNYIRGTRTESNRLVSLIQLRR